MNENDKKVIRKSFLDIVSENDIDRIGNAAEADQSHRDSVASVCVTDIVYSNI